MSCPAVPLVAEAEAVTAPLPGAPQVFTPAMRAADDAYRDHLKARVHLDRADTARWLEEARERTFARLDAWLAGRD